MKEKQTKEQLLRWCDYVCVWFHNRVVSGETSGGGEEEDVSSTLQN